MSQDEIVAVVDKNGNITKKVKRSELNNDYTWRIICIWIENSNGQVLLQQRSYKKKLGPGLWTCAVEGTVEDEDTYETTAEREILEEIGLDEFELQKTKKILYHAEVGSRLAQGFIVKCDWPIEKFTAQKSEVEKLEWRDKKETIKRIASGDTDFPPAAKVWLDMFNLV